MKPRAPDYSFARYLSAKRTVDDRALNKDVIERLRRELSALSTAAGGDDAGAASGRAVHIVELGAGLGAMVPRLVDWGVVRRGMYTLLEMDASLLAEARRTLRTWSEARGYVLEERGEALVISGSGGLALAIELRCTELGEYLASHADFGEIDLLLASAFLDLVDLPAVTPRLVGGPRPPKLCWFSLNFDGETSFEPAHPADAALLAVYHRSMDERMRDGHPAGDSRSGRHLFGHLRAAGATVLAAGASDWVVFPEGTSYPADERYFLHHLVHTVELELGQHAEVDVVLLAEWVAERHQQIERGELVLVAHQLDLLARPGAAP
jgi:hypothetical protein